MVFAVLNKGGAVASVNRTVMVVEPCADGEVLCEENECSAVDCELR